MLALLSCCVVPWAESIEEMPVQSRDKTQGRKCELLIIGKMAQRLEEKEAGTERFRTRPSRACLAPVPRENNRPRNSTSGSTVRFRSLVFVSLSLRSSYPPSPDCCSAICCSALSAFCAASRCMFTYKDVFSSVSRKESITGSVSYRHVCLTGLSSCGRGSQSVV